MTTVVNLKREPVTPEPPTRSVEAPPVEVEIRPTVAAATPPVAARAARSRSVAVDAVMLRILPPVLGYLALIGVWALAAQHAPYLPGPVKTWQAALTLFSDPFYVKGPNDVGVGWLLLNSLKRVAVGFGLAIAVGVPLGFMIGRFMFLNRALLRPVSPLAWLPIGLAVFKAADPSAIFVIFITSIWPMVINTALGVASVPQDYLNVARVLRLSEWKVFTKILFPATLPYMMTGMRLGLGIAWLVIVAAEMLTGGIGIGFWIWDEWNNLNMEHIIIAIFIVGAVGLILEQCMTLIASRFDYRNS
ncbi:MAG: nitrate ABC transporter permease [Gammaproteobacteria bacterium]|nr:nitrate ABC transporter permease [Gammaproteobacteria bacterium]